MRAPLDTVVQIETPEHIVFEHRLAGPARRALAHVLDLVLCYGVLLLVGIAILFGVVGGAALSGELSSLAKASVGLVLLLVFIVQWVYFAAWEALTGRTPGKRALGLAVVTTTGRPIGVREATLRNLLRAADVLPVGYVVGLACQLCTQRFQRLGDLVAGTMVVVPERARGGSPIVLRPPATAAELASLPQTVRLDPEERAAIELFLRRRGQLGAARERELAELIAPVIAARVGAAGMDPVRLLALVFDLAARAGRDEGPVSSRGGS